MPELKGSYVAKAVEIRRFLLHFDCAQGAPGSLGDKNMFLRLVPPTADCGQLQALVEKIIAGTR